ncbi:MAG: flagellar hook-associated protein FlgK [Acidobacteriota bacterium]
MSLTTSLNIAAQSLLVDDAALQTTNNNIANANTPGYSRQVAVFNEVAPTNHGAVSIGNGVALQQFQSIRDELLQTQIEQQTQAQAGISARLTSLQQIEPTFTTSTQDIGTQMTALFSSLSSLGTDPTSGSQRANVIAAGQNLANSFNTASRNLTSIQTGLNKQVSHDVSQINALSQQIAALNPQINALQKSGQDGGTLVDQQDQLVLQLSQLTNASITQTSNGITITTGSGTPLVVGSQSFGLQTAVGSAGMTHVLDGNGTDITSSLTGGDLGGTAQTRDGIIPKLLGQLDTLANEVGSAFNAVQAGGYDQGGKAGQAFFNVPVSTAGSAGLIGMALTNPAAVAASSDGSPGDSGNLANFAEIQTSKLSGGATPVETYANLVYQVGSLTSNLTAQSSALSASLTQLNDQRSSVSGVSIDQEATNLIQYQQAYQAAARVVSTVQQLFQVTISMGTA